MVKCLYAQNKDSADENESVIFLGTIFDNTMDGDFHHIITTDHYNVALGWILAC